MPTPEGRRRILPARLARGWCAARRIGRPATLLRWRRNGFRRVWRARAVAASPRPQGPEETVALSKRIAAEHRLWGAERIRGALRKLVVRVGTRTVLRDARPPLVAGRAQPWSTFVRTHADAIGAGASLPVVDLGSRARSACCIVEVGARLLVHIGVTRHPTDAWVAEQLRAATPFGAALAHGLRVVRTPRRAGKAREGSANPQARFSSGSGGSPMVSTERRERGGTQP